MILVFEKIIFWWNTTSKNTEYDLNNIINTNENGTKSVIWRLETYIGNTFMRLETKNLNSAYRIFWSKINIFLIYVPKDSSCSCDHFHTKILVVGGHLRRRNLKNNRKNAISHICFVTSSMTSALWVIHHMKALNLNFDNFSRLSAVTTWWRYRAKCTRTWQVDQFIGRIPRSLFSSWWDF